MKYVIGLDAGTNSIGWALTSEDDLGRIAIIKTGVHIFPIGTIVDDVNGKEQTKNKQRRQYRGASRMRYRYKLRRKNLKIVLHENNMLPDFAKYHKSKGKKQSYELYRLRAEALDKRIDLDELGRIFMLMNKYRGFQSNAKKLRIEDEEDGRVKAGIDELQSFMDKNGARTIGEYFYLMHKKAKQLYDQNKWHNDNEPIDERAINHAGEMVLFKSNGIRRHYGRYTARDMYKREFDMIWHQQKSHYSFLTGSKQEYDEIRKLPYKEKIVALQEFKNTLYWKIRDYCIYYQRPLKSQKKYVSNCQFVKSKKVIPASHPLFQEFRIYKQLADVRFSDSENHKQPLRKEWRDKLAFALQCVNRIYFKSSKDSEKRKLPTFFSILNLNDTNIKFLQDNPEADKYIDGNKTFAAIHDAIGNETFEKLRNEGRLDLLWHHLYIAKDGLMKEEDWLKSILTETTKWNFPLSVAQKLIENGLEPEYGSYSTRVIKAILPFMRQGDDEYTALVKAGFRKSVDEVVESIPLKEKISQLKYQELRNPVAERAVSQAIKIVNALLEQYKDVIDRDRLEIRIESTRELRKPKKERERLRSSNLEKDKLRQEYADFLNEKKEILHISSRIEKYDSLINKFELWLEMGLDVDDINFSQDEFRAFLKITKPSDKLKHKLWLECNRICPYSNQVITLGKLFTAEIQIEHIIPLSRSLDDSFNNKTLTFQKVNAEKGARTSFEYMKSKDEIKLFKRRITNAHFNESKIDQFLLENVPTDFTNSQISNTSYIAKFIRKKMQEVCKIVQFTNGSATAELRRKDWKLSNLLDKICYEEETGKNMDDVFRKYYSFKRNFVGWLEKKMKSTDFKVDWSKIDTNPDAKRYQDETKEELIYWWNEVNLFNQFKSKSGKKDRSDHRHHAIDAFIIACCSPKIIKELSTFNAVKEERNLDSREEIERNFNYEDLKKSIKEILVSHQEKQTLIKKRINKIRTREKKITQVTFAPQGKLHQESYYSKVNGNVVRRVELYSDKRQDKVLFESKEDLKYKGNSREKWNYIPEEQVHYAIEHRLNKLGRKALSKESMEQVPLYMASPFAPHQVLSKRGKPLPIIKSVRKKFKKERSLINLPAKDFKGNILFENRWADNEDNYLVVFYKSGKKRFAQPISFFKSVQNKRQSGKLIPDEVKYRNKNYGIDPMMPWIKKGDILMVMKEGESYDSIDWNDKEILRSRLFKVKGLSSTEDDKGKHGIYEYTHISLQSIFKAIKGAIYAKQTDIEEALKLKSFSLSHVKLNAIKVRLNVLGEIIAKGDECF